MGVHGVLLLCLAVVYLCLCEGFVFSRLTPTDKRRLSRDNEDAEAFIRSLMSADKQHNRRDSDVEDARLELMSKKDVEEMIKRDPSWICCSNDLFCVKRACQSKRDTEDTFRSLRKIHDKFSTVPMLIY